MKNTVKKPTVGIFRTLPESLVKRERAAAIGNNKSLDAIASAAYDHFFNRISEPERTAVYADLPAKKFGRKVK